MRKHSPLLPSVSIVLTGAIIIAVGGGCAAHKPKGAEYLATGSDPGGGHRRVETLVLLGTNDLHGTLLPQELKTREAAASGQAPVSPISYEAGGIAVIASFVSALRAEFGPRLLWLDAGDQLQGSIESGAEQGAPMVEALNRLGLNAAAVGDHEFDFGPESRAPGANSSDLQGSLKTRLAEAKYPYLASNLLRAEGASDDDHFPLPHSLSRTLLQAGSLKVGVFGLTTLDAPRTTRAEYVRALRFGDLKTAALREAHALREAGADVVVLTAHAGLRCDPGRASSGYLIRKPNTAQGECEEQGEIVQLLRSLPAGTIDAVVSGHSHQVVHHWVAGVPVIQGAAYGRYLNLIYLNVDLDTRRVIPDRTRIEGPIPVCPRVFANQHDCNGDRPAPRAGRGELAPLSFHGHDIQSDPGIAAWLEEVRARTEKLRSRVIGQASRPVENPRARESELGNLVADALRAEAKADFAIVNPGYLRAPLEAGPISYGALFRSLPFDNAVVALEVTGRELKRILRVAESGARGFMSVSGLRLKLIDLSSDAPSEDLDGDGRIEPWEINRLLEVKTASGEPLEDARIYRLGITDFLAEGGDDLSWVMSQIPPERKRVATGPVLRDAVTAYLAKIDAETGPLNTEGTPLIRAGDPRIQFEKSSHGKLGKKRRRRR